MTALKISLLGSFQVTQGNKPVTAFKSNKDRALLAYLAVEAKQVHSRDKLATLLWADMADRDARNNLRYTLSSLRRTIGDREANPAFLLISRDDIQWNHASQPQIDTTQWAEFTTAVSPNNPDISQLQQAVTLHRSSFLDGFALSDSLPFDEWLMLKREQYHRELIAVLSTLANCFEQNGRYAQALTYAQQLIRLEPWQEETQRQIMRLLAYQGRRSEALAQYEMCCLALQTELRIAPEATTSWLYEQIRDGALQIPQPPPLFMQDDVEHAPAPIFVARQQELDQLHDTLNQVLAGHGQLSFVVGEAGTGKTSLLKEFAVQAQRQHPQLLVAGGHGIAYTGKGNPFAPIYQLFDMLTGDVEARWSVGDVSGEQARRLWHMLPHTTTALVKYGPDLIGSFVNGNSLLRRALAHPGCDLNTLQQLTTLLNTQATMPPGTAVKRQHLFEQVRRVLMELARERPLLITLDDLQWADDASIILLAHLTPLLAGQHIFIIGSYRPEEVTMEQEPNRHPLAPFINQCQRQWGDVTISLDKEHDQEFLKALLDTNPNHLSANFRSTLLKRTQGHPLFTVELLDGMKTKGDIFQDNAGFWTESPTLNWNGLPARVDAAIGERIARLPANLRTALAIAAVEGETFTVEVITSIQNDDTLLSEFSGSLAQEHRLIRAVDLTYVAENPLSRYQFRHNLFQHYLYTNLDTVQRTQYHAAIGQSLATLYQTDPTAIKKAASHLAWHFDKAGLPAQAVTYYQQAAHHARQLSAYGEVIAHCQRALALLDTLPENRERIDQKIDFLINMGNSAAATHGYGSPLAGQARRKALTLCRQLDNTPQLLPALWSMVAHYYATAEHQTARELCQQLIAITEQLGDPVQKALAHWMLGLVLFHQGEFAAAHEALTFPVEFLNPEEHHYLAHVTDQDPTVSSLLDSGEKFSEPF